MQSHHDVLKIKAAVRERDGNRCQRCGLTREGSIAKNKRNLDVHRLIPDSEYDERFCTTLCMQCHANAPERQMTPEDRSAAAIKAGLQCDPMRKIAVSLSPKEKRILVKAAEIQNISVPEFLKRTALVQTEIVFSCLRNH